MPEEKCPPVNHVNMWECEITERGVVTRFGSDTFMVLGMALKHSYVVPIRGCYYWVVNAHHNKRYDETTFVIQIDHFMR